MQMYIEQCPVCLLGALKESYTPDFPKILHLPVDGTSSMTVSTSSEESKVSQVRCAPWWLTIDVSRKTQALLHSWLEKLLTLNFLHQARCWIRWLGKDSLNFVILSVILNFLQISIYPITASCSTRNEHKQGVTFWLVPKLRHISI